MIEIPSLRPETRYGIPACDRYLFNRMYVIGYSYLLRQPRFAMQVINDESEAMAEEDFERLDNFREDMRIPDMFRSTPDDYDEPGFDQGHLINSKDKFGSKIINSETFLMSNMAPQTGDLNRKIWLGLEDGVRELAKQTDKHGKEKYAEIYTICGPIFNSILDPRAIKEGEEVEPSSVNSKLTHIGKNRVAVPHGFFKAVLAERTKSNSKDQLEMWCFEMPNDKEVLEKRKAALEEKEGKKLRWKDCVKDYLVPTRQTERRAGLQIWDKLRGEEIDKLKDEEGEMWELK